MLGRTISDPGGVEGVAGAEVDGLGLLDVVTRFSAEKVLRLHDDAGYEIHHGVTSVGSGEAFRGGVRQGHVLGTMRHGVLESDAFRRDLLAEVAGAVGRTWAPSDRSFAAAREERLDLLGDLAEEHLDVDALFVLARR
jgi:adenosylcobyric acid synthase